MTPTPDETRREMEDRLADHALQETVGGKTPPDLTGPITNSLATPATPAPPLKESRLPLLRYALAASLAIGAVGLSYYMGLQRGSQSGMAHNLGIVVDQTKGGLGPYPTSTPPESSTPAAQDTPHQVFGNVVNDPAKMPEEVAVDDLSVVVASPSPLTPPPPVIVSSGPHPTSQLAAPSAHHPGKVALPPLRLSGGDHPGPLPTPFYAYDDVQHAAPGPEFKYAARDRKELEQRESTIAHSQYKLALEKLEVEKERLTTLHRTKTELLAKNKDSGKVEELNELKKEVNDLEVNIRDLPVQLPLPDQGQGPENRGDNFSRIVDNEFKEVMQHPLSTFSIDVDTASYAIMRRSLEQGMLPQPDSVRIEELINNFAYDYAPPTDDVPFASHVEVAVCPWNADHKLVRVGLKGKEVAVDKRPPTNLVFLLDVSGSMSEENKLPYVVESMKLIADQMTEQDRVAIVVYAGAAGLVLPSTPGHKKSDIIESLNRLEAGGSTNGGQGIELAYSVAVENFIKDGVNRVILCTDGDFNVGTTGEGSLERLIEEKAKTGVFLSVYGFGMGNLNDAMLEKISGKGNGTYGYIDTLAEAKKLFVRGLMGTLVTIAKDVKIQIEFNPHQVAGYRLIGYENRMLAAEDFNDDKKDAGEIGAGHTVTALYEIVPKGQPTGSAPVDPLKYQTPAKLTAAAETPELLTLKLRYKQPDGAASKLLEFPVKDSDHRFGQASADFRFASSVAAFGMLLRHSSYSGNSTYASVSEIAQSSLGPDPHGDRKQFLSLILTAQRLSGR